ncbi:uncharacterized protein LOC110979108 [Acanthaster planci]|uniref:Uncharacterized protein LOC110979108 n=1 Tax=Acanthaster planci TaxID=133434 RepID=A0A8B7YD80_ACAPL|nr:uncharacterized protein LOC110979108 [Acanthaster planci]
MVLQTGAKISFTVIIFVFQADAFLSEWTLRAPCDDHFFHQSTNIHGAGDDDNSCTVFLEEKYYEDKSSKLPLAVFLTCLAIAALYTFRVLSARDCPRVSQSALKKDTQLGLMKRLRVHWWDEQPGLPLLNWERCPSCHRLERLQLTQ